MAYPARLLGGVVVTALLATGAALPATPALAAEPVPVPAPVVLAAAGDIACAAEASPGICQQRATADLVAGFGAITVLPLGDLQYEVGGAAEFATYYEPSWGRFRAVSRPVVGNHEYGTSGAAPYWDYFNGASAVSGPAGDRGKGWYSYDTGGWHVVALNSNCKFVDCTAGGEQERWLRADLAAHPAACTLAYWHHPRWTSDTRGDSTFTDPLVRALHEAGADVLLSGHVHSYERFAPMDPSGAVDDAHGLREFVVGTGGKNLTSFGAVHAGSVVRDNAHHGALRLELSSGSYGWSFRGTDGGVHDAGSSSCHGAPPTPPAPPPSATLTFAPTGDARVQSDLPDTAFGTSPGLRVDGTPAARSLLKFDVRGLAGRRVRSAELRLRVTDSSNSAGMLSAADPAAWDEASVTWAIAPPLGTRISAFGAAATGTWATWDVTSLVAGDGPVGVQLSSTDADAANLASREAAATSDRPQLVVTVEDAEVLPDATAPTAPTSLTSATPSGSQVVLSWSGATDDRAVTGYDVLRDGVVVGAPSASPFTDAGVVPGRTYAYAVRARDAAGNTSAAATTSVTTPTTSVVVLTPVADAAVDSTYPTTNYGTSSLKVDADRPQASLLAFDVRGLAGRAVRSAALRLKVTNASATAGVVRRVGTTSWSEAAVTWSTAPAADPVLVATGGAAPLGAVVSFDVTSAVQADGPLGLHLSSTSSDGADFTSREGAAADRPQLVVTVDEAVPAAPDTTPPTSPTLLAATATGLDVALSWGAATDAVGVTGYRVRRDDALLTTTAGTSITDRSVEAGPHTYGVTALDAAGNASTEATVQVTVDAPPPPPDTTPPPAPAALTATPALRSVLLDWSPAAAEDGVVGYELTRSGAGPVAVASPPTTDAGLSPDTAVSYALVALDAAGNRSTAAFVSTQTLADTTAPTSPSPLTATASSPTRVSLSWPASTDDIGVTGYLISRTGWSADVVTAERLHVDDSAQPGTYYTYSVRAVDAAGNSSAAASAAVTTPAVAPVRRELRFLPTADAFVRSDRATTRYGTTSTLQADATPATRSLLGFSLAGIGPGRVVSARLVLTCTNPSAVAGVLRPLDPETWAESTVTWATAPPASTSPVIASAGAVAKGAAAGFAFTDLSGVRDGRFGLELTSTSADGADYASRESHAAASRPVLVVVVEE